MKKLVFLSLLLALCAAAPQILADVCEERDVRWNTALTAGYVFKNDCNFKQVYGHGMANCITADVCYSACNRWGLGTKVSYWRATGCTTFLRQRTVLQEVPLTFYLRRIKNFDCGLQLYASLGGGVVWAKEKSYLGCLKLHKGIGEVEVGLNYQLWRNVNFTSAFRYLFPKQSQACRKVTIGGSDLRAGFAFLF